MCESFQSLFGVMEIHTGCKGHTIKGFKRCAFLTPGFVISIRILLRAPGIPVFEYVVSGEGNCMLNLVCMTKHFDIFIQFDLVMLRTEF